MPKVFFKQSAVETLAAPASIVRLIQSSDLVIKIMSKYHNGNAPADVGRGKSLPGKPARISSRSRSNPHRSLMDGYPFAAVHSNSFVKMAQLLAQVNL